MIEDRSLAEEVETIRALLTYGVGDAWENRGGKSGVITRAGWSGWAIPQCWLQLDSGNPVVRPLDDLTVDRLEILMLATNIGSRWPCYFYSGQPNILSYPIDRQTIH